MNRRERLAEVARRLDGRRLVFFGIRGDDVEGLTDVPGLDAVYSVINRYEGRLGVRSMAWEDLGGSRPDLDTFSLDAHLSDQATIGLRDELLRATASRSAVVNYRASAFLSTVVFARAAHGESTNAMGGPEDWCQLLGLHLAPQAPFEFKPWVESIVRATGVPCLEWKYFSDSDTTIASKIAERHPVMLRPSQSTGGVGMQMASTPAQVIERWPHDEAGLVSLSKFHEGAMPINVGGVVWGDGSVTLHPGSVQLIGINGATERPFGFCGNDFGRFSDLDPMLIDAVDRSAHVVGQELGRRGYLGAFGVDFIVVDGSPLFMEVNPRFQGSTHLSSRLSVGLGLSCILLDHVAACLGVTPGFEGASGATLRDLAAQVAPMSHLVVHQPESAEDRIKAQAMVDGLIDDPDVVKVDVLPRAGLTVETGGVLGRATFRRSVTSTGYDFS